MGKPVLLDLFCAAGGSAMGYHQAGFQIVGVDINHQKNYPFQFIQSDVFDFLDKYHYQIIKKVNAIHASPPCQAYSQTRFINPNKSYSNLIPKTREYLIKLGIPYVIENVPKAPLINPITLCGTMFSLKVFRHRCFESNFYIPPIQHNEHKGKTKNSSLYSDPNSEFICVVGNMFLVSEARKAMEINWMIGKELSQAIPPSYTKYIGKYLMQEVTNNGY